MRTILQCQNLTQISATSGQDTALCPRGVSMLLELSPDSRAPLCLVESCLTHELTRRVMNEGTSHEVLGVDGRPDGPSHA